MSRLPKGYALLEYLQSSGTQWIDTKIVPASGYKAEVGFQATKVPTGTSVESWILALYESSTVNFRAGFVNGAFWSSNGFSYSQTASNTAYTVATGTCTSSATISLYMFAQHEGTSAMHVANCYYKLYYCKIWDANGNLARDFVPAKRSSDGVLGLYDLVNNVFYTNAGTGTFTAGPVVPEQVDESEITELEYIESSATQYANTGYLPNQNTRMILDAAFLGAAGSNVAGVRNSTTDTTNRFGIITFGSASKIGAFFRDSSTQAIGVDNERHVFDLSKGGISVDGTSYGGANSGAFACAYSLVLFGWNNGSGGIDETASRVYGCQLFELGLLERDYIPAMLSNGEVGLYDKVNSEFYRNAGTGEFIAGPEIVIAVDPPAAVEQIINVKLAWTAVDKAISYKVYRDGALLAETEDTVYVDETAELGQTYVYGITACSKNYESDPTELTVYTREGYAVIRPVVTSANFP